MLPTTAAVIWLTMLTSLLICWAEFPPRDSSNPAIPADPPYPSMYYHMQRVPYISDIAGSPEIKPFFILGCVLTSFVLDASVIADRWLRHRGRLAKNTNTVEKVLACCGIVGAMVGTMGLIFLGIFDVWNYRIVHEVMLGFFIGGYSFTALFTCLEYYRMGRSIFSTALPHKDYLFIDASQNTGVYNQVSFYLPKSSSFLCSSKLG
jgi:hypothetical protein